MRLSNSTLLSLLVAFSRSGGSAALPTDYIFQSGPDHGNTYVSSIEFDSKTNQLYVAGSTYGSYWNFYDNNDNNDHVSDRITKSTCFVGILDFDKHGANNIEWTTRTFPNPDDGAPESCKQLLVARPSSSANNNNGTSSSFPLPSAKLLLLGNTRNGGTLSQLHVDQFTEEQYGMVLDMDIRDVSNSNVGASPANIEFLGGRLLQDGPVQYPMGMVFASSTGSSSTSANNNYYTAGDLYVVSMQSFDTSQNDLRVNDASQEEEEEEPDLNQWLQYGSSYTLLVERFFPSYEDYIQEETLKLQTTDNESTTKNELRETWMDGWRKPYAPNYLNGESIHVAGITTFTTTEEEASSPPNLVVIGSTAAHGSIFATPTYTTSSDNKNVDGFLALLSSQDGSYLDQSIRIESFNSKDDHITNYCQFQNNLFIVGTTHGGHLESPDSYGQEENAVHAFVMNIDLKTFQTKWIKQMGGGAADEVHGVACSVTQDGNLLYFGGTVLGGSPLSSYGAQSHGGDDVFIVQISLQDTNQNNLNEQIQFVQQWGTSHDDHLVDITTDGLGNAIVVGNTNGSILRRKKDQGGEDTTDMFILVVSQSDGSIQDPLDEYSGGAEKNDNEKHDGDNPSESNAIVNNDSETNNNDSGIDDDSDDQNSNYNGIEFSNVGTAMHTEESSSRDGDNNSSPLRGRTVSVYAATMFVFFLMAIGLLYITRAFWMPFFYYSDGSTDKSKVLTYLEDFDIKHGDVHLKRSVTYGWHGSYNNDLAEGINNYGIIKTNPTQTAWRYTYDPERRHHHSLPPPPPPPSSAKKKKKKKGQQTPLMESPEQQQQDENAVVSYRDDPTQKRPSSNQDNIKHLDACMNDGKPWNEDSQYGDGEPWMTDII